MALRTSWRAPSVSSFSPPKGSTGKVIHRAEAPPIRADKISVLWACSSPRMKPTGECGRRQQDFDHIHHVNARGYTLVHKQIRPHIPLMKSLVQLLYSFP